MLFIVFLRDHDQSCIIRFLTINSSQSQRSEKFIHLLHTNSLPSNLLLIILSFKKTRKTLTIPSAGSRRNIHLFFPPLALQYTSVIKIVISNHNSQRRPSSEIILSQIAEWGKENKKKKVGSITDVEQKTNHVLVVIVLLLHSIPLAAVIIVLSSPWNTGTDRAGDRRWVGGGKAERRSVIKISNYCE